MGLRSRLKSAADGIKTNVLGSPSRSKELGVLLVVNELTSVVPKLDAIIDSQSGRSRGGQHVLAVGAPLATNSVSSLKRRDLNKLLLTIIDINTTLKVTETSNKNKSTVG